MEKWLKDLWTIQVQRWPYLWRQVQAKQHQLWSHGLRKRWILRGWVQRRRETWFRDLPGCDEAGGVIGDLAERSVHFFILIFKTKYNWRQDMYWQTQKAEWLGKVMEKKSLWNDKLLEKTDKKESKLGRVCIGWKEVEIWGRRVPVVCGLIFTCKV